MDFFNTCSDFTTKRGEKCSDFTTKRGEKYSNHYQNCPLFSQNFG
ncbi:MAG: hypothetical protein RIS64_1905 [Bacteroidota bacterium]|jgi:hypothetical protein